MLTYEIEQAVDRYELPLIIAYVDYKVIANPSPLSLYWPNALNSRIANNMAKAIHTPFVKDALLDAIDQFSANNTKQLSSAKEFYSRQAHQAFGVLNTYDPFVNTRK